MNTNTLTHIISSILAFISMICISLLIIVICLALTLFNIGFISAKMDEEYYNSALVSLNDSFKNEIAPPSGFPEEVFDEAFNIYILKEDSVSAVKSFLLGLDFTYDSSRIEQILMTRFKNFADEKGISLTDTNLDTLVDHCLEAYERHINVTFLKSFAPIRRLFDKYYVYLLMSLSLLLIISVLLLFKTNYIKHRAVRYCIYSLFASSLIIIPAPLVILIHAGYRDLSIVPEHIKMLFVSMIQSTLLVLVIGGIFVAIIGFLLIPMVKRMRKKVISDKI